MVAVLGVLAALAVQDVDQLDRQLGEGRRTGALVRCVDHAPDLRGQGAIHGADGGRLDLGDLVAPVPA